MSTSPSASAISEPSSASTGVPTGVCALSGANGARQVHNIDALTLPRGLSCGAKSPLFALWTEPRFSAGVPTCMLVELTVEVEDIVWKLRFPMPPRASKAPMGKSKLHRAGQVVLKASMFQDGWNLGKELLPRHSALLRQGAL